MKMGYQFGHFRWLIVAILPLIFGSCSGKLEEEVISYWPDGKVQKVYFYERLGDFREKVLEERYYENGRKEMHGEFKDGKRDGEWIYWFQDGRKWTESHYEDDLRIGKAIIWRKSGYKNYEGSYANGKPHGTWTFYDVDGSRNKDVIFEHGQKVSEFEYKEGVPFSPESLDTLDFIVH